MIPSNYFIGAKDGNDFILKLEECMLHNGIQNKNKYLLLKFSLKGDALLCRENIDRFFGRY